MRNQIAATLAEHDRDRSSHARALSALRHEADSKIDAAHAEIARLKNRLAEEEERWRGEGGRGAGDVRGGVTAGGGGGAAVSLRGLLAGAAVGLLLAWVVPGLLWRGRETAIAHGAALSQGEGAGCLEEG